MSLERQIPDHILSTRLAHPNIGQRSGTAVNWSNLGLASTHVCVSDTQEQGDGLTHGDRGQPGLGGPPPLTYTHIRTYLPVAPPLPSYLRCLPSGNNTMFQLLSQWSLPVSAEPLVHQPQMCVRGSAGVAAWKMACDDKTN